MYGNQPETQMLQLWSNHRRRTAYALKPVTDKSNAIRLGRLGRGMLAWMVLLGVLVVSLSGCVAHYPAYGYSQGYSRGYGHHHHGYSDYDGGYGKRGWRGHGRYR